MGTVEFLDLYETINDVPNVFEMLVFHNGLAILNQKASRATSLSHINGIAIKPTNISAICCNVLKNGIKVLTVSENVENSTMENCSLFSIVRLALPDGTLGIDAQGIRYSDDIYALKILSSRSAPLFQQGDIIFDINGTPIGTLSTQEAIELFNTSTNRHISVFRNVADDFELFNRQAWRNAMMKYMKVLKDTSRIPKPLSFKEPYRSVTSTQLSRNIPSVSHFKSLQQRVLTQPSCGIDNIL